VTILRDRKGPRTFLGLLAAVGLVGALAMPVLAGADVDWATLTGYAEGSAANNNADAWGDDCTKINPGGDTYVLPDLAAGKMYTVVIVKAGSDVSTDGHANSLFANPAAGQTVWADANGSGTFNEGDKIISHLIYCVGDEQVEESEAPASEPAESEPAESQPAEESEEPAESQPAEESEEPAESQPAEESEEPEESIREGELGGTPTPAPSAGELPDTAFGDFGSTPATVLSLVLIAALAGMVYVRLARQR
jgi:hypothetical protein